MDFEEGEVDDISDSDDSIEPVKADAKTPTTVFSPHSDAKLHASKRKLKTSKREEQRDKMKKHRKKSHHHDSKGDSELYFEDEFRNRDKLDSKMEFLNRKKHKNYYNNKAESQCRFFKVGRCHRGDACIFSHQFVPSKKSELCKFYAAGSCSKPDSCLYMHEEYPCKFYHRFGKCHNGLDCKFSHDPLTEETRKILDRSANKTSEKEMMLLGEDDTHRNAPRGVGVFAAGNDSRGDFDRIHPIREPDAIPRMNRNPVSPPVRSMFDRPPNPCRFIESAPLLGDPDPNHMLHPHDFHPPPNRFPPPPQFRFNRPPFPRHPPFREPMLVNDRPPAFPPSMRMPFPPCSTTGYFQQPPPPFSTADNAFNNPRPLLQTPPLPITSDAQKDRVSSELDKMAQLLAANLPSNGNTNDNRPGSDDQVSPVGGSSDSTPSVVNTESLSDYGQTDVSKTQNETNKQAESKPSLPPPTLGLDDINLNPEPFSPIYSWKLTPLDMTVKIPYPLMSLDISDLPHRFEDPRLRGQINALQFPPRLTNVNSDECGQNTTEQRPVEVERKPDVPPIRKRPFRMQLNELANTGVDRLYLDNPLLRIRRVSTAELPSQTCQDNGNQEQSNNAPENVV